MGSFSNILEFDVLNHLLRTATISKRSTLYCALHTADPTDVELDTEVLTSGTAYARQPVAVDDLSWTVPTLTGDVHSISNLLSIEYPAALAPWGTPSHWSLWDTVSGGDMLVHGAIGGVLRSVDAGDDPVSFAPGSLTITMGAAASYYLREQMLNHLFRSATFAKLGSVYVGLYADDPLDTPSTEFTGVNYGRVAVAVADASWTIPDDIGDDKFVANVGAVQFLPPLSDWGTYNFATFHDASTAGNLLIYTAMTVPRVVNSNDNPPVFLPGNLQVQIG